MSFAQHTSALVLLALWGCPNKASVIVPAAASTVVSPETDLQSPNCARSVVLNGETISLTSMMADKGGIYRGVICTFGGPHIDKEVTIWMPY